MPSIVQEARQSPTRQPLVLSRAPEDDERYVMCRFAGHATGCAQCKHPLELVRKGTSLCRKGTLHAEVVTQYLYSRNGKVFSPADRDMNRYVQVQVPKDCAVVRELMLAVERGLSTDSQKPSQKRPEILLRRNNTELRRYTDSSSGKGSGNSKQLVFARPVKNKSPKVDSQPRRGTMYGHDLGYKLLEAESHSDGDLFYLPHRSAIGLTEDETRSVP